MCHIWYMSFQDEFEYVITRISLSKKKEAEEIIHGLGLDMSSYLRLCIYQLIQDKAIPFQPHLGSEEDIIIPAKKRLAVLDYIDEE